MKSPVEIPFRYSAGISASMLGRPAHKPERNRIGEPPSATVSNPKLTNFNATNSTDLFPAQ